MKNHYIIFDTSGVYRGYSTVEYMAKDLVNQRKGFQPLKVQKLKGSKMTRDMVQELSRTKGEVIDYYGTYLFEHEYDDIHDISLAAYSTGYSSVEQVINVLDMLNLSEQEKDVILRFKKDMEYVFESIPDEYICAEAPYTQYFRADKLSLSVLEHVYTGKEFIIDR